MATKNTKDLKQVKAEEVQTVSKTDQFYAQYKKTIWGVLGGIIVLGLAVLGFYKFIYTPKCEEAQGAAIQAEQAFQEGNFELALEGDGNVLGFAQVAEEYGSKAGQAVYLYAGVCALQLERYEEAVDFLKKYSGKDPVLAARAYCCMGDAYVGLEDYKAAVAQYKKAVKEADNAFAASYLLKEGLALEALGEKAAALECYKQIKDKYAASVEAYDIDRYISAVEE